MQQSNSELFENNKALKSLLNKASNARREVNNNLDGSVINEVDTPIGYDKTETGIYVFNTTKLEDIDEELSELNNLLSSVPAEYSKVFTPKIKKEINKLKDVRSKYLKNYITETMLRTISSAEVESMYRMVNPISFDAITDAITEIKDYLPVRTLDLSDIADKQAGYSGLSAGVVLTGAFANAVKVIAYISRSGPSNDLQSYLNEYGEVRSKLKSLELQAALTPNSGLDVQINQLKALIKNQYSSKQRKQKIENSTNSENTPTLVNKFTIDDKVHSQIEYWDSVNNYKVSEVFDTLINAAIDNLKLGHLENARINVMSGSVVVGLLSVGVPMNTVVKILYQPIFDPLFSGKINRLDVWLSKIKKELEAEIADSDSIISITTDELLDGLKFRSSTGDNIKLDTIKANQEVLRIQLAALRIFERGNKIGEDIRNLADYMNLIRELDVFIEDIDQKAIDFSNNVGNISYDPLLDESVLITHADFSLNIPNLFRNNPHLAETQKTFESLQSLLNNTFLLHSEASREFAKRVYTSMDLNDEGDLNTVSANLANMRRSLAHYILTSIA